MKLKCKTELVGIVGRKELGTQQSESYLLINNNTTLQTLKKLHPIANLMSKKCATLLDTSSYRRHNGNIELAIF